jgi:Carbohydrate esterase, sialic acid-specific acetylesterase
LPAEPRRKSKITNHKSKINEVIGKGEVISDQMKEGKNIMKKRNVLALLLTSILCHQVNAEMSNNLPVKIYVMVGQSNMQGKGAVEGDKPGALRYLVTHDPNKEYQFLVKEDGSWRERPDVWIHYDNRYGQLKPGYGSSGGQIGPELGFGHVIGDASEGQVLLIKACWGGKSLGHDFLPPSVGKYPSPSMGGDPGFFYHQILQIVKDVTENMTTYFPDYKGQGIEIAGLGWHQGWNDQYGGLDAKYEENMAAFIKDIRSSEHGLGVPGLPVVIATSGMIPDASPIKPAQRAMADETKHPEFKGNVGVVDTDTPYGPKKLQFKFSEKVGYHWDGNAQTYLNIGRAMGEEMRKLVKPSLPARLAAYGTASGVQLTWQLGSEATKSATLLRNGKALGATLSPAQTTFLDADALPGKNDYELIIEMKSSPVQKLTAFCDTSVSQITAYRSIGGVMLSWQARGKYDGFKILRDRKVIAEKISVDTRRYEDKEAPDKGIVTYTVEPTTGTSTPATVTVKRGPIDPGDVLFYEPFDYPADSEKRQSLVGKGGVPGTKGEYRYLASNHTERAFATLAGGLSFYDLPVTGNRASAHRWSAPTVIELGDNIKKAGLLEDGATMWISFLYQVNASGIGLQLSLESSDGKEGLGFSNNGRTDTFIIHEGKKEERLLTKSVMANRPVLFVGKMTWGKDGQPDALLPYELKRGLQLPESPGRTKPFDIDQSKLSRLVLGGADASDVDEIRIGPTYESVVGSRTKTMVKPASQ